MSDRIPGDRPTQRRLDAVRCPHCEQVTMANLLGDGSVVCSCTAERALPLDLLEGTPWDGETGTMPAPVDAAPGPGQRGPLPEDKGQFGRDIETEAYERLRPPPGPERGPG
ncbi:hypothetical protein [Roseicella frigidaeris]|uniref:Uncharacterized protein n=1 Tax=Roseicella frigidaeris TaxID=2230885 RepID=A0A327MIL7_9PROT|nr:hypothetical protein [Roseicella frigidaeris]RAI60018.1 hypothetical protein DOO78_07205 [Roseicella frigidaeris]